MITLKPEIIERIHGSKMLKLNVQAALGISHTTLYKYLADNDPKLANINVIHMLKKELGLKDNQILTK